MQVNLDITQKRRALLERWLTTAMVNNRTGDGNYFGLNADESRIIDGMLVDTLRQLERGRQRPIGDKSC